VERLRYPSRVLGIPPTGKQVTFSVNPTGDGKIDHWVLGDSLHAAVVEKIFIAYIATYLRTDTITAQLASKKTRI